MELAREGAALPQDTLTDLDEDVRELRSLVEDVLTTARLELAADQAGDPGPRLRREQVDLRALLDRSRERFLLAAPGRSLRLRLDPALPARFNVDPTLLRRALDNLLDNAKKYSAAEVELSAVVEPEGLRFEVLDHGLGLGPDEVTGLFTPFFRGRRPRSASGVGLGLLLTRRIVEAHGGTIEAHSELDVGTRFVVRIPWA